MALSLLSTAKPGWGALLASGDFDFITSASGTAVSAISIDGCFSAGYDHYLVMKDMLTSVDLMDMRVRLRASATDDTGTNYRQQRIYATAATVVGERITGQTNWRDAMGFGETTAFGFNQLWVSNPFAAVRTTAWSNSAYDSDGSILLQSSVWEHDATTSYDGLTVYVSSGTITGTIYVYGLAV